jgi:hypothetical protein
MLKKYLTPTNILAAVCSILLIIGILIFLKYQSTQMELNKLKSDPRLGSDVLTEVGKLMVLPEGETPTIATVTDVERLRTNQPFFNSAKNGDKVIVYSKKAILYDPVAKKIIDTTIINPGSPSPPPAANNYKFTILNGTPTAGLGLKYETSLKKIFPNAVVTKKDFAKKNDYTKTILVDISKTFADSLPQIAQSLSLPLEKIPEGEDQPTNTDFLIIIGSNYQ